MSQSITGIATCDQCGNTQSAGMRSCMKCRALMPVAQPAADGKTVVGYMTQAEYQRDVAKMANQGYTVVSVIEANQNAGCLRITTIGIFALVVRPKPHFLVTYQKSRRLIPDRSVRHLRSAGKHVETRFFLTGDPSQLGRRMGCIRG